MTTEKFSETGIRHLNSGEENQDAVSFGENKRFSVISLADGASYCKEAGKGAGIAAEALANLLLKKGEYFLDYDKERTAALALEHILYEIKKQAEKDGCPFTEYSSTIAGVLFDKADRRFLIISLGDSLIMGIQNETCRVLAMPADSTYGNITTTSRNAEKQMCVNIMDASAADSAVIFSNGAWRTIFEKNRLKTKPEYYMLRGEYAKLGQYLKNEKCRDDCSFISLNLRDEEEKAA